MIKIKRVYDPPSADDGIRILVDRLWPRGIRREDVKMDLWMKDVAPSNELRKWFSHEPSKWDEFRRRYGEEIKGSKALEQLRDLIRRYQVVTLLFSAKDRERNNAVVLRELLSEGETA